MNHDPHLEKLLTEIRESLEQTDFIRLTLSSKKDPESVLKNITIKVVSLKAGHFLSFVYRYPTQDITKNYPFGEGVELIRQALQNDFFQAVLQTASRDGHYLQFPNGRSSLKFRAATQTLKPVFLHDRQKKRLVPLEGNQWMPLLGITTAEGKLKKGMEDKYRQIDRYVELLSHVIEQANLAEGALIADMGAGKGYLTFALYDYLVNQRQMKVEMTGVELRKELVSSGNKHALKAGFRHLSFIQGAIGTAPLEGVDMLIALHACDTATDEALFRGITQKAGIIVVAPCCHKQVRKHINPVDTLRSITRYGILEERQAEILTDSIRALILEAYGYETKVFEFISTEHTPKNVLITGVLKHVCPEPDPVKMAQVSALKELFGLEYHHLEKLLNDAGPE